MLIDLDYEMGDYEIFDFSKTPLPFELAKGNKFFYVSAIDREYFRLSIDAKDEAMRDTSFDYYNQMWVHFHSDNMLSLQRSSRLLRRKAICS